jgi:topoisomerase-4 subunit A
MRISRYDRDKAEENILALEGKMEQVKHHLANFTGIHLVSAAPAFS